MGTNFHKITCGGGESPELTQHIICQHMWKFLKLLHLDIHFQLAYKRELHVSRNPQSISRTNNNTYIEEWGQYQSVLEGTKNPM